MFLQQRLQCDWAAGLSAAPNAIVSTSAIHHLESQEKQELFARCFEALSLGGVFINGDEVRPARDAEYLAHLKEWSAHMNGAIADRRISESFRATLDHWYDRNINHFGEPKKSRDDCVETVAAQLSYLGNVGFKNVEAVWEVKLWAVLIALKSN
jgi:tRNA (cmo5U34)-methyltransferase